MKKILFILIICGFMLSSCSPPTAQVNTQDETNISSSSFANFIGIGDSLVYDSITKIVYFKNYSDGRYIYIPYYASNGMPYRYNSETNMLEEINMQ